MCCVGDMLHARIFACIYRTTVSRQEFGQLLTRDNNQQHPRRLARRQRGRNSLTETVWQKAEDDVLNGSAETEAYGLPDPISNSSNMRPSIAMAWISPQSNEYGASA